MATMTSYLLPPEMSGETGPDGVVIPLAVRRVHRLRRGHDHPAAFEHERQGALEFFRPQLGGCRALVRRRVRPVRRERVVQRRAAWREALSLRVVDAAYQPHELGHDV